MMEDVRIYDFEFNLLHIEHDIVSCNWTLNENAIGSFEMHFPLRSSLTALAMNEPYLVAVQGEKQAIITGRQLTKEGVLYGKSCNWILTRFCVAERFDTDSLAEAGTLAAKDAQSVCRYILTLAAGDAVQFEENSEAEFGEVFIENKSTTAAFDLLQSCLSGDGAGHEVRYDVKNKRWVFKATKGRALKTVLSDGNKNTYETEYTDDIQNRFTGGWYEQRVEDAGDWDAAANEPYLVDNVPENYATAHRVKTAGRQFGIDFAEGDYIVCKDKSGKWERSDKISTFTVHIPSETAGLYAWETALSGETEEEAKKNLAQKTGTADTKMKTRGLLYGRDYHLGDTVTVELQKGDVRRTSKKKITGVSLWYEGNGAGEQPILEEAKDEL